MLQNTVLAASEAPTFVFKASIGPFTTGTSLLEAVLVLWVVVALTIGLDWAMRTRKTVRSLSPKGLRGLMRADKKSRWLVGATFVLLAIVILSSLQQFAVSGTSFASAYGSPTSSLNFTRSFFALADVLASFSLWLMFHHRLGVLRRGESSVDLANPPTTRPEYLPLTGRAGPQSPIVSFVGGMRYASIVTNWTWPLVRLTLGSESLSLGPSVRWLSFFVTSRMIRYDQLVEVQAVGRNGLLSAGVRFRASDGQWVIFWASNRPLVLDAIGRMGIEVRAEPIRFNYFSPG